MLRILVTGSNGFIGSNLCKYLKNKGDYVIGLGRQENSIHEWVDDYFSCEISSERTNTILDNTEIDAMVHLAADMRHAPYEIEVVAHNCVGTQRLLELCENKKVPVFVQLSSLPVIGRPVEHPITENHPLHPPTVYHVTKNTEELLANYAFYTHGLRTVSFRISAPLGIGMNQKTIFPTFVRKALAGEDIELFGQGTRKQNYVHVDDISQAIYRAIITDEAQGVYNLSSNNLISNKDLAEKIIECLDSKSKIAFNGSVDPMDNDVWDVSLEHIFKDMGYVPEVDIEYAIREQADYLSNK